MIYIAIALVVCIGLIVFKGVNITLNTTHIMSTNSESVKVASDIFDSEGEIKAEYDNDSVTMDEYIREINTLMTSDDKELNDVR